MAVVQHTLPRSFAEVGLFARTILINDLMICGILMPLHLVKIDLFRLKCGLLRNGLNLSRRAVEEGICPVVEGTGRGVFGEAGWYG